MSSYEAQRPSGDSNIKVFGADPMSLYNGPRGEYYRMESFDFSNNIPLDPPSMAARPDILTTTQRRPVGCPGFGLIWIRVLRLYSDSWTFELLSMLASVVLLVTLIIYLQKWDGRPIAAFDSHITLNTLTLVLSLCSKLSMLMPLSSSIGQLRWIRAKQGTTLKSFYILDLASRGPLGAIRVMFSKFTYAGAIGSLIVALTLAFEAFAQQAISTKSPNQASVLVGENLPFDNPASASFSDLTTGNAVDLMWVLSQTSAVWGGRRESCSAQTDTFLAPDSTQMACGDGPCTSRKYGTFELCSQCTPILSDLTRACDAANGTCTWSLPSGLSLNNGTERFVLKSSYTTLTNFSGVSSAASEIINLDAIALFNATDLRWDPTFGPSPDLTPQIQAQRCSVSVCASEYVTQQLSSTDTPVEHRVSLSRINAMLSSDGNEITYLGALNNTSTKTAWPYRNLCIKTTTLNDFLKTTFSDVFTGKLLSSSTDPSTFFTLPGGTIFWEQLYSAALSIGMGSDPSSLSTTSMGEPMPNCINFENGLNLILVYLTDYLRNTYGVSISLSSGDRVSDSKAAVPRFAVHWPWLALPIALLAATLLFLAWIMIVSKRRELPLWRSSLLAAMYHGIDVGEHVVGTRERDLSAMEGVAGETRVWLRGKGEEEGLRLVRGEEASGSGRDWVG